MSRKQGRNHHHGKPKQNHPSAVDTDTPPHAGTFDASKENEGPQNVKKGPDLMTIFTGVLACFAIFSFIALVIQLEDARENFSRDQRPYIWASASNESVYRKNVEVIIPPENQQPIKVSVWYNNYGRSPAIVTSISTDAEIAPNALQKLRRAAWQKTASVLPSGKSDALDFYSTEKLSPENRGLVGVNRGYAAYMRIRYHDLEGHRFESDLCFYADGGSTLGYCPAEFGSLIRMIDCEKERCEE